MIIGVIGGIGAGKSTVLDILEKDFAMKIYRTDDIAKNFYKERGVVYQEILSLFGSEILNKESGDIDTKRLSEKIFGRVDLIERINQIVHPAVWGYVQKAIGEARKQGENIVIETALPSEEFLENIDSTVYVYADQETRIDRLTKTRGFSREEAKKRILSQRSDEAFRDVADYVLDNTKEIEDTKNAVYKFIQWLQR